MTTVKAPPKIIAKEKDFPLVHLKQVKAATSVIKKYEHPEEYVHQGTYSVYGWYKWDSKCD